MNDLAAHLDAAIRSFAPVGVFEAPGSTRFSDRWRVAGFPVVCLEVPDPTAAIDSTEQEALPEILILALPRARLATGEPDRTHVLAAAKSIGERAPRAFVLVIDPPYPGSTRRDVEPHLPSSGVAPRREYHLACASGIINGSGQLERWVVGGCDEASAALACRLLEPLGIEVDAASSLEAAETAGSLRSSARSVLTALANEWKRAFDPMGIDLGELLDLSGAREEFPSLLPTVGESAPEPFALNWALRRFDAESELVERAGEVHAAMSAYVVSKVTDALNDSHKPIHRSRILVVGIECPEAGPLSPAREILRLLQRKRAVVGYHDPMRAVLAGLDSGLVGDLTSLPLSAEVLADQDAIVIVQAIPGCDWGFLVEHSALVVDTRNATRGVPRGRAKIVRA